MSNALVKLFGWRATLHHGDPLVWDRWRWLARRLRKTRNDERVLDVGCGSGAFTIGAAKRGYRSLGLSWDERNQAMAAERARICGAQTAEFEICDVRELDRKAHLLGQFDAIICTENIEHILDDFRLVRAMAGCLKPGGRLLLTSPYLRRWPWSYNDYGPFPDFEDGRHVRRGYNKTMLREMCQAAGLEIEEISYVSGPISQLGAMIWVGLLGVHPLAAWLAILPLRPFPPLLDRWLGPLLNVAPFCIGLEAMKPRIPMGDGAQARRTPS